MVNCCSVAGCQNRSCGGQTGSKVSLHQFPKDEKLLKIWIKSCGREATWIPSRYAQLCSAHFTTDCYEDKSVAESLGFFTKRRLKADAIPTLSIAAEKENHEEQASNASTDTADELSFDDEANDTIPNPHKRRRHDSADQGAIACDIIFPTIPIQQASISSLFPFTPQSEPPKKFRTQSTQVNIEKKSKWTSTSLQSFASDGSLPYRTQSTQIYIARKSRGTQCNLKPRRDHKFVQVLQMTKNASVQCTILKPPPPEYSDEEEDEDSEYVDDLKNDPTWNADDYEIEDDD